MAIREPHPDVRDPKPLWWWMRLLVILASLVYFTVAASSAITWAAYANFVTLPTQQATIIDNVTIVGSRSLIWALIICGIATLRLAYRLTNNLEQTGDRTRIPPAGWVCSSFFLPIANLFMPPILIGRVWRATFAAQPKPAKGSAIIGWWWTAWIVSAVLMGAVALMTRSLSPHAALTPELRNLREVYWGVAALGYGLRGVCCYLLLGVFGALVGGQVREFDASDFD